MDREMRIAMISGSVIAEPPLSWVRCVGRAGASVRHAGRLGTAPSRVPVAVYWHPLARPGGNPRLRGLARMADQLGAQGGRPCRALTARPAPGRMQQGHDLRN